MAIKFKNIAVIGGNTPNIVKTLQSLINHLQLKKINVFLASDIPNTLSRYKVKTISQGELKDNCDLILVVGGDGSLLRAARIAAQQNLPIVGINRGAIGFLTDIAPRNLAKIDEILAGKYYKENRFLLATKIVTQKKPFAQHLSLNDVVLLSSNPGHLIEFTVYVDQKFLCSYRADGLIVATPTGSTAHALSSGGPILYPGLENIVLVPVLSHNLSSRPIVISSKSKIKIVFDESNTTDLLILCDGQKQKTIISNGTISISKAKEKLRLLHPLDYSYFETLRTKLNWEKTHGKI